MKVNVAAIERLASERQWSIPDLAKRLGVEYSYLFRVLRGERQGGSKLFAGLYRLCAEEELDFERFVFLD